MSPPLSKPSLCAKREPSSANSENQPSTSYARERSGNSEEERSGLNAAALKLVLL